MSMCRSSICTAINCFRCDARASVNTGYTFGVIITGFFLDNRVADWLRKRQDMTIHCFVTIITTFIETSSLRGLLGCFIAGYILNGPGQGVAFVD
ncbi:hypothetical protein SS1G_06614 [Sclerotinia sclerotiorum 1980 UF-70]|uniref:Uncharacterized protein n=1 Tax=Sclerotinia sclerotiorum (strain ATCC 18683 / 1980 / Ss-1) TaxID=665079 RepID=A7EMR5_SCLS1|nr:hypothetical protein SS1G_06614 [Sclerotinia sclerotiorum 1980 UF-70]EDO04131.1 hypothetical protein SS1G_06614 [Sclerotinia sclerotiorum 1980 UF-70]